jgi:hypothetical protein
LASPKLDLLEAERRSWMKTGRRIVERLGRLALDHGALLLAHQGRMKHSEVSGEGARGGFYQVIESTAFMEEYFS